MFTFDFAYADGKQVSFQHVQKVTYRDAVGETVTVDSDSIKSYEFPLARSFHLYSEHENATISGTNLRTISAMEE